LFGATAAALLVGLGVISYLADWKLFGEHGWVWLVLSVPETILVGGLVLSGREHENSRSRKLLLIFLGIGVLGNLAAVLLLVGALLTAKAPDLTGAQLLTTGAVVWVTNVIVFGLCFWTLDAGGPARRVSSGRLMPDFRFPQDEEPGKGPWHPRFEDYLYVAVTNGIAFSPTDAMPLTRSAKRLMTLEALISVAAVLVIVARAVNVVGS
jgi:uncharacterized membrane protein